MAVRIPPPEEYAKALLRVVGVERPSDMTEFAAGLGLRVREVESKGFEAALIRVPGKPKGIVGVSSGIREPGRRRFTIAHEIGHYLLPGHGTDFSVCKKEQIESLNGGGGHEAAADSFASELLMPAEQIIPIIKADGVNIDTARAISDDFQTSLRAAARKCVVLSEDSCALVISVDGVVRGVVPSKSWIYKVPRGGKPAENTLASRMAEVGGKRHQRKEINAMAWVTSYADPFGVSLMEDSILLPKYNTVVTILTEL